MNRESFEQLTINKIQLVLYCLSFIVNTFKMKMKLYCFAVLEIGKIRKTGLVFS